MDTMVAKKISFYCKKKVFFAASQNALKKGRGQNAKLKKKLSSMKLRRCTRLFHSSLFLKKPF